MRTTKKEGLLKKLFFKSTKSGCCGVEIKPENESGTSLEPAPTHPKCSQSQKSAEKIKGSG